MDCLGSTRNHALEIIGNIRQRETYFLQSASLDFFRLPTNLTTPPMMEGLSGASHQPLWLHRLPTPATSHTENVDPALIRTGAQE
jgi:hypothetical protein